MRMLIVEDEARLRLQLARHFSEAGWVVEEAADGREALYMGNEHPYDIAIVDLGLPVAMADLDLALRCQFGVTLGAL